MFPYPADPITKVGYVVADIFVLALLGLLVFGYLIR